MRKRLWGAVTLDKRLCCRRERTLTSGSQLTVSLMKEGSARAWRWSGITKYLWFLSLEEPKTSPNEILIPGMLCLGSRVGKLSSVTCRQQMGPVSKGRCAPEACKKRETNPCRCGFGVGFFEFRLAKASRFVNGYCCTGE